MKEYQFHDEYTLSETAEELAKKALKLGIIPSFSMRCFSDSRQFYIPNEQEGEPLTPERAYLLLKKMIESNQSAFSERK